MEIKQYKSPHIGLAVEDHGVKAIGFKAFPMHTQIIYIPNFIYLFIWGFTLLSTLYRSYHDG